MKGRKKNGAAGSLRTPAERVGWLLQHHWAGDRSRMAKDNGLTYTAIVKVVTGQQEPGRRLLAKLVEHSDVNAAWLLAGRGYAFGDASIPVTRTVGLGMPGPEQTVADSPSTGIRGIYSPTRYWLQIQRDHPLVQDEMQKVQPGDRLLMETDRDLFRPGEEDWRDRLCIVRTRRHANAVELGEVTYYSANAPDEPERLEVRFFQCRKETRRLVVDESPKGVFRVSEEWIARQGRDAQEGLTPIDLLLERQIKISDIAAVCILLLRC